jgi:hypothetical protein
MGLKLFKFSLSIDVFLIPGYRRPSLSASGKTPSCSEELTSVVITGSSSFRQDFKVLVEIGSEGHYLEGDLSITVRTVSTVTSLNSEKKLVQDLVLISA